MTAVLVKNANLPARPPPTDTPAMHGIDSLGFVEMILDLEELTEHEFETDPGVTEHSTLDEIATMVAKDMMQ